jgi:hypothetical protein
MRLWSTRTKALDDLAGDLKPQAAVLQATFDLLDSTIERFAYPDIAAPCRAATRVCLAKARNLSLGCYSLILDGLAQEAGALMRPLVECYELLKYFQVEPAGFQEALDDRLPSAGEIAKRIDGQLKSIREYFNTHASHLSYHEYSIKHLVDESSDDIIVVQPYRRPNLVRNGRVLFVITTAVAAQGVRLLQDQVGAKVDDLVRRVNDCRVAADEAFDIPEYVRSLDVLFPRK